MSIAMAKVRANRIEHNLEQYSHFVETCLEMNRQQILFTINKMGAKHVDTILESFCSTLLHVAFAQKTQEQLLELIKGGSLISLHRLLEQTFRNDTAILEAIERGDKS